MAFNKDEALKAKEVAEKKLAEKDFAGAQELSLKAHNLYAIFPPASIIPNIRPTSMPSFLLKRITFWTKCSRCSMHLEYSRLLLYKFINCMSWRSFFWAAEESPPSSIVFDQRQPFTNYPASSQSNVSEGRCFETSHMAMPKLDPWICKYTFNSASNGVRMPSSTATQAECLNTEVNASKRKGSMDERKLNSERKGRISQMASKSGSSSHAANVSRSQKEAVMGDERISLHKINKPRAFSQSEMRNLLIGKAMSEVKKKVEEWKVSNVAEKEGSGMEKRTAIASAAAPGSVKDRMKGNNSGILPLQNKVPTGVDTKAEYVQSMRFPDSDFHDFDEDRMEASFAENQVWAAYDCDDGMPSYYAMIKKVVSKTQFKTCIHWLNSKNNNELRPMKWVVSGFPKTCGDFWIGKSAVNPSEYILAQG